MRKAFIPFLLLANIAFAGEKRIKIAVIDTGISPVAKDLLVRNISGELIPLRNFLCHSGHRDFTETTLSDAAPHGTHIAAIIAASIDPKKTCMVIIKWYHTVEMTEVNKEKTMIGLVDAIRYASSLRVEFMNLSLEGNAYIGIERAAISEAISLGIHVVVSAGNKGIDLDIICETFPACYKMRSSRFRVVGALTPDGRKAQYSNFGSPVTNWEIGEQERLGLFMRGTSQAAAVYTGRWVAEVTR